jgi:hypothetical protein
LRDGDGQRSNRPNYSNNSSRGDEVAAAEPARTAGCSEGWQL